VIGLGGQVLVVLAIMLQGGLFATGQALAHVGSGSLCVLSLLLFWYGRIQTTTAVRHSCNYAAGLLFSLVVSWEIAAWRQTELAVLVLAPATYMIVIAPFLMRDEALPDHHRLGQICSTLGATLLLLPTLWTSFSEPQLQLTLTLVLGSEALALVILGIVTHMRFFILSGAGLVVISAIHLLFLPSLGIPTFLALTLLGIMLLAIATLLIMVRSRLASLLGG
jgi:hypothetical protein